MELQAPCGVRSLRIHLHSANAHFFHFDASAWSRGREGHSCRAEQILFCARRGRQFPIPLALVAAWVCGRLVVLGALMCVSHRCLWSHRTEVIEAQSACEEAAQESAI